jgi:hypothetical protein
MLARKKLLVSVVGVVASLGVTSFLMPGCYGRQCDGDVQSWGPTPDDMAAAATAGDGGLDGAVAERLTQGHLVDPNTWESNDVNSKWLPYLHARTWHFYYPQLGVRQPDQVTAYISANENPNMTADTFITGGGNVAKFYSVFAGGATLANDSCADFFVRVVVHVPPYADAGTSTDASASDAGSTDAGSTDAGTD